MTSVLGCVRVFTVVSICCASEAMSAGTLLALPSAGVVHAKFVVAMG